MTANTPTPARLMSSRWHMVMQIGGQLITVFVIVLLTTLGWTFDGEPTGFPWRTLLVTAALFGPIFGYIGIRLAAPFVMCHGCRAVGYVQDIRPGKRCPACRAEKFCWIPWSQRPYLQRLKNYRPAFNTALTMTAVEVIDKAERRDSAARILINLS